MLTVGTLTFKCLQFRMKLFAFLTYELMLYIIKSIKFKPIIKFKKFELHSYACAIRVMTSSTVAKSPAVSQILFTFSSL